MIHKTCDLLSQYVFLITSCKRFHKTILYINSLSPCVRLWPLDAEKSDGKKKSDGGRREKWWEKDKTTVGWRAFEVLKPRSWEPGPETSRWGPETQVLKPRVEGLKPRSWNLTLSSWNPSLESQISKSWNPGPENVRALLIGWSN